MLTKLYINNFRCLVGFEINYEEMDLFCGVNGTGKSSVLDALKLVRDLAIGNCFLGGVADESKRTISQLEFCKWVDSDIQSFELELEVDRHKFFYQLQLQQVAQHEQPRIYKEVARCDGVDLYTRAFANVRYSGNKEFSLDWRQSALSVFQASKNQIELLQQALKNIIIIRPNARMFETESRFEAQQANLDLSNIISWYRYLALDQEWTDRLRQSLQMIWPSDFNYLKLLDTGADIKRLQLDFPEVSVYFSELSDGEKMLLALYMIHAVLFTSKDSLTVFIDEPDNFISVQELQPWMLEMREIASRKRQVVIISHNADILESPSSQVYCFYRDNHKSQTRVKYLEVPEGLTIRETLARGWV